MPDLVVGSYGAMGRVIRILESSVVVESIEDGRAYQVEIPTDEWKALEVFSGY